MMPELDKMIAWEQGELNQEGEIQRLISSIATRVPIWVDTTYKTLAEARRDNPREYPSWFRRKPKT